MDESSIMKVYGEKNAGGGGASFRIAEGGISPHWRKYFVEGRPLIKKKKG